MLRFRLVWINWMIGFWFWPVHKDLAVGIDTGPLKIMWTRDRE